MTEEGDTEMVDIHNALGAIFDGSLSVNHQDNEGETILMKLCYLNLDEDDALETLDRILTFHPDVNLKDNMGRTAFAHACLSRNYVMADGLLFLDSTVIDTVDENEFTPLTHAIMADDEQMVEKVLSHPKARGSALLTFRTNGQTPLEMALSLDKTAIIDTITSCTRYSEVCPLPKQDARDRPLPEVRTFRRVKVPERGFVVTKSHSDPLLLRRIFNQHRTSSPERSSSGDTFRKTTKPNPSHLSDEAKEATHIRPFSNIKSSGGTGNSDESLPSLSVPHRSCATRRGSLSLPDLNVIPVGLSGAELHVDTDSEESDNRFSDVDNRVNDSDNGSQSDLEEVECTGRAASIQRRKNSISLPDLSLTRLSTQLRVGTNQGIPDSMTNTTVRVSHFKGTNRDTSRLHLPDIHLCNSPSLPCLDQRHRNTKCSNSFHDLNSSVRRPVSDHISLQRFRSQRKADV